jgi:hypothetical protein
VNGLLLGYLFYRSGLVPRQMAMLGLIGGPVIFASAIAVLFGHAAFPRRTRARIASMRRRASPLPVTA